MFLIIRKIYLLLYRTHVKVMDFILHIDHYMVEMVQQYHTWTYAILFAVIFL